MDIQWDETKTLSHSINYRLSVTFFKSRADVWSACPPSKQIRPIYSDFISEQQLIPLTLQVSNNLGVFNCSPTERNMQIYNPLIQ